MALVLFLLDSKFQLGHHLEMAESKIAPGFLIASPQLKDPNFEKTVILMIEHDDEKGALGLVINQRTEVDLVTVLGEMKLDMPNAVLDMSNHPPLLCGGPVSPERGWVVHTSDWTCPESQTIAEDLSITTSLEILNAIVNKKGPSKYRFCLGYAGWGPHQLVGEIKSGAWLNLPLSTDLIFDTPLNEIWTTCFNRLGIDPKKLVGIVGDA